MIKMFDSRTPGNHFDLRVSDRINSVIKHGKFILGPEVTELEKRLCDYTEAKFCITCGNGTDALQIAMMAIGIGPGDEVITPAFGYIAIAEAIKLLGATPRFVEVDSTSFNLNAEKLEEAINHKTKAITAISLFGQPAEFTSINSIGKKYNIPVIEDAAQSFGSSRLGIKSTNLSKIACTSFFPTKPLGCFGDGGAIFTSDEKLASIMRMIARHGQDKKYSHMRVGVNSRLDTIQAAILLEKLNVLDSEIERRNEIANTYLSGIKNNNVQLPKIDSECTSAWAQFTLKCRNRAEIIDNLNKNEISYAIHYPLPLYKQKAIEQHVDFKITEKLCETVLSIPCHAYLYDSEISKVIDCLNNR